jgi:dTDP-L-rhamnose 4-epimerase
VHDLARIIASQLNINIEPLARGEFRPGEIRSLLSDITRARTIGYSPSVTIEQGIAHYIEWIRTQGEIKDYFAEIEAGLRAKGIVQSVATT